MIRAVGGSWVFALASGDLDVFGSNGSGGEIRWWSNDVGDGTSWTEQFLYSLLSSMCMSLDVADIDGDGDIDVVASSESGTTIAWWEDLAGDGLSSLEHPVAIDDFPIARSVCAADLDADGVLDILGASDGGHEITWWKTTCP